MKYLRIKHFKCFEDIDISLNQLTVMAGINGNGKSTSIQALLFLRHSIEQCADVIEYKETGYVIKAHSKNKNISLNSNYCLLLGNSSYVLNRNFSNEPKIFIGLEKDKKKIIFEYEVNNLEPQLSIKVKEIDNNEEHDFEILKKEFYYLNAERIGPRINQGFQFFDFPNAGFQGEFVAQLISEKGGYLPVDKDRIFVKTTNPGLEFQVNKWLDFIIPGVIITSKQSGETQTSQVMMENIYTKGEPTLATNLGFGISYVLPIIVTGLIAIKGSYFIVENPEAHLHPSAQSKIGRFLAMVADAGVNVIVETHSDHIINGIQIAVAEKEIAHNSVTINFFNQVEGEGQPKIKDISINEKGELSQWPKGFFDQTQIDYSHLFKLRK